MNENPRRPVKRKVNPALLLGSDTPKKDSQPELVETDSFTEKRPVKNFRGNPFGDGKPSQGKDTVSAKNDASLYEVVENDAEPLFAADETVESGAADHSQLDIPTVKEKPEQAPQVGEAPKPANKVNPVKPSRTLHLPQPKSDVKLPSVPKASPKGSSQQETKPVGDVAQGSNDVVEAPKSNSTKPIEEKSIFAKKDIDIFGGSSTKKKAPLVEDTSSDKDDSISKPSQSKGLSVAPPQRKEENDKPKRQVNPMFLAGEEKEQVVTKPTATPPPRPSFFLDTDKVPTRRPPVKEEETEERFVPKADAKPRAQYSRKIEANVDIEEWDDEDEGTQYGLGGEIDAGFVEPQYAKGFHLTERDLIIMRFLARYRYAYVDQIARLVDSMPRTIVARMRVLEKRGFLRKEAITDKQYLWTTRKAGNLIADIAFPEIKKGTISYATIAHTIGLGNLGVEFEREAGGKDLLGEGKGVENWEMPENRWRLGIWGNEEGKVKGEMTVTEREIRQGQLRWRGGRSTKEMRELVSMAAAGAEPVELEEGQEGLFVIYGAGGKGGEHIPDMVIARERDENGKPQHIAVELELTPKTNPEWRKILRNYRDNGEMYSKVYYFTHKRAISSALIKIAEEVGMADRFIVRKYTPRNSTMPFWG